MEFKLLLLLLILLFSSFVVAGKIGDRCEYTVYGDSECDTRNNIYCIDFVCAEYTGNPVDYCNDSDGNDEFTYGAINWSYRTSDGVFSEGTLNDGCIEGTSPVTSCQASRTGCYVQEFNCTPSEQLPYSSENIACEAGCELGLCLQLEPESPEAGDVCDFGANEDADCDVENNLYCIDNVCAELNDPPSFYCINTDVNIFVLGALDYSFRDSANGEVLSGTKIDTCCGVKVKEYSCISPIPDTGLNYTSDDIGCDNGCSSGVCVIADSVEINENKLPETISDQELLGYISKWSKKELAETEEENDSKIMEIIGAWKNN